MKNSIYIAVIILLFSNISFAQQNNTLYFMDKVPTNGIINPSQKSDYKFWISGLILPIAGQLPPALQLSVSNTGFSLIYFLKQGSGTQSDSMVTDFDNLILKLSDLNYVNFETHLNLISGGFHVKNHYIRFGITEKIESRLGYPKDLINFLWNGNYEYMQNGEAVSFKGLGPHFTHYREYMVGATHKFKEKFTFGANLKVLFGKSNIRTKYSDISIETQKDSYFWNVATDIDIKASLPMEVKFNDGDGNSDSLKVEVDSNYTASIQNITKYLLNGKNFGLGFDLGATFKLNDKFSFSASVIDLGFIRWATNPVSAKSKGEFLFEGYNLAPGMQGDSTYAKVFSDSLFKTFNIEGSDKAYITSLTSKVYLSASYTLHPKISFNLLSKTEIFRSKVFQQFTISANSNLTKWFTATINYSYINRSFVNMGAGFAIKGGPIQFFMMTDNFLGFYQETSTKIPMPYSSRMVNLRFGMNLCFGKIKDGPAEALIE